MSYSGSQAVREDGVLAIAEEQGRDAEEGHAQAGQLLQISDPLSSFVKLLQRE
jgi:hypothetical protein